MLDSKDWRRCDGLQRRQFLRAAVARAGADDGDADDDDDATNPHLILFRLGDSISGAGCGAVLGGALRGRHRNRRTHPHRLRHQ